MYTVKKQIIKLFFLTFLASSFLPILMASSNPLVAKANPVLPAAVRPTMALPVTAKPTTVFARAVTPKGTDSPSSTSYSGQPIHPTGSTPTKPPYAKEPDVKYLRTVNEHLTFRAASAEKNNPEQSLPVTVLHRREVNESSSQNCQGKLRSFHTNKDHYQEAGPAIFRPNGAEYMATGTSTPLSDSSYELEISVPEGTKEGDLYQVNLVLESNGLGELQDRSARNINVLDENGEVIAIANPASGPGTDLVTNSNIVFRYTDYVEHHSQVKIKFKGLMGIYVFPNWGQQARTFPFYFTGCEGPGPAAPRPKVTFTVVNDVKHRISAAWYHDPRNGVDRGGQLTFKASNTESGPRTVGFSAKLGTGGAFNCQKLKQLLVDWKITPLHGIGRVNRNETKGWRVRATDITWENTNQVHAVNSVPGAQDPGYIYCSAKELVIAFLIEAGESISGVYGWNTDDTPINKLPMTKNQERYVPFTGRNFIVNSPDPFNRIIDLTQPGGTASGDGQQNSSVEGMVWQESNQRIPDGLRQSDEQVIPQVRVRIKGSGVNQYMQTDKNGNYHFQVPPGKYQIEVVKPNSKQYFAPEAPNGNLFNQSGHYSLELKPMENRRQVDAGLVANQAEIMMHLAKVDPQGKNLSGAKFTIEQDCTARNAPPHCQVNEPEVGPEHNGHYQISKLRPNSSYRLTEVTAPTGYQLFPEPIYFTVQADGKSVQRTDKFQEVLTVKANTLSVTNYPRGHLPQAGGRQTKKPLVAGIFIVASAICLISTRRTGLKH